MLLRALEGYYIALPIPLWCPIDYRSIASQLITLAQPEPEIDKQIDEIRVRQIRFKCYTRYKSNADE